MRHQKEALTSDRTLESRLEEALKRLVTILARQTAREEAGFMPALIADPVDER
jgi:hypothetical protein